MRRQRTLPWLHCLLFGVLGMCLTAVPSEGQQPVPGSQLPNPRLLTITPMGAKIGATIELGFSGTDLEEPESLIFSIPGVKAELIKGEEVVKDDPKDPKKKKGPPMGVASASRFKVTVPANAPVGIHDVRFVGKHGISNPRAFVVGDLNEVDEKEPNDDQPQAQKVEMNSTINGGIANPTEIDYYAFTGKKGDRVVVSCLTSSIDSKLNAVIELYDASGKRLAENRNYRGDDALLDAVLPADGEYNVRVNSFTYTTGGTDHFYRLSISTTPWIDSIQPCVVEPGKPATLTLYGRNLPGGKPDPGSTLNRSVLEKATVTVNVPGDAPTLQKLTFSGSLPPASSGLDGFEFRVKNPSGSSNPYLLVYGTAPVVVDTGDNDSPEKAQAVKTPCEISGAFEKRRDRDWFSFEAKKGEVLTIEAYSDRLGAPTDLVVNVYGADLKQSITELDDDATTLHATKFYTRNNDPQRYRFEAKTDGKHLISIRSQDGDVRGGPNMVYRLRLTPEKPDFRLIVMGPGDITPDTTQLLPGTQNYLSVLVWRQDGFNGPITVSADGLPAGVTCAPQIVGNELSKGNLILACAADAKPGVFEIKVKGEAEVGGQKLVREARSGSVVWPVAAQQNNNIPTIGRLDRNVFVSIRDKAPFNLTLEVDKTELLQGDKASATVKLQRIAPEVAKVQFQVVAVDLPQQGNQPALSLAGNKPITLAPGTDNGKMEIVVAPKCPPGTYSIVVRGTAVAVPMPPKDPKGKPANIAIILPSNSITVKVVEKPAGK